MTLTTDDTHPLHRDRLRPRAPLAGSRRAVEILERPRSGVGPVRSRRPWVRRFSLRSVAVLASLLVMTAGIGAYLDRVVSAPPTVSYPVTAPSPLWLRSTTPAAVNWFRADLVLPGAPTAGVMWVDARDMYRVWINGRVAATNRAPARQGALPIGEAVDVRALLRSGRNVVAIQVSGLGEQTAALWTRIHAETGRGSVELATGGTAWKVTSQAGLTGSMLGEQPAFVDPAFSLTGWSAPQRIPPVRVVKTTVPEPVIGTPAVTALSARAFAAAYTLSVRLQASTTDSWLQVAATGALSVSVNGQLVSQQPSPGYSSPNSHRSAPLFLLHLGTRLQPGSNQLVFHVTGSSTTAVAVGLITRSQSGDWLPVPTSEAQWSVRALGEPTTVSVLDGAARTAVWPNGFTAAVQPLDPASSGWIAVVQTILPGWLLSMLLLALMIVVLRWRLRIPGRVVTGRAVLCLAPGTAAIVAALAYGRWITVEPGFPYSAPVAATVVGLLALPALGLLVAAGLRNRTPNGPLRSRSAVAAAVSAWVGRVGGGITRRLPFTVPPHRLGIVAIAVLAGVAQGSRLGRQPLWQDEVTSIVVAKNIAQHGLPRLDSGLFYFKAELYHALLAVVLSISDNPNVLRSIALLFFVATVLAFGCLLMPTLTSHRGLQVIATAIFVLVPAETAWARDVRMYQQMQFFAVVFLALYIRAARNGRTRDIVGGAIALLAMYLSHEESFVLLPALPLMALAARRVVWSRRRIFLAAYVPVGIVIAVQYAVSHIHPPDFGEDLSNRPYVGWDPDQADFYYQKVFFSPIAQAGSLAILSTLAIVAIIVSVRRRDTAGTLSGIALCVTVMAISLVLTAKVDRYSFVTIPLLVALAVVGASHLVGWLARWRSGLVDPGRRRPQARWLGGTLVATVLVTVVAAMATLVVSPRGFGLWAADLTDSPNPLTHPDYAPTIDYLRQNERPGDQVISLAPPVMTQQYLGRTPDRVIQTGRNKLLYLVLRDGQAVETILGVPVLLTGEQIRTFLEAHRRVWLVSDAGSYIQGVPPDVRSEVGKDFRVVSQDAATTVSLWDAG